MQATALRCRAFSSSCTRCTRSLRAQPKLARGPALCKHVSMYSAFMGTRLQMNNFGVGASAAAAARPSQTTMSFFGVGAPEAILVAIVSLIVFGPKGLAEAAKSIGQSLRAFQPTIKEVVEVSQDLRSTLESELGLDELRDAARPTPRAAPRPLLNDPSTLPEVAEAATTTAAAVEATAEGTKPLKAVSETFAKAVDPDIEAKRAASAAAAWGTAAPAAAATPAATPAVGASVASAELSLDELEAELARRRQASKSSSNSKPSA